MNQALQMNISEKIMVRQQSADWDRQIVELNARGTDSGMVVILGNVLFENGKSRLKRGASSTLYKLAVFLIKHQSCTAVIEGYTDNTSSQAFNIDLSLRRAQSVKSYLVHEGVNSIRLVVAGNGENFPIANNDCASGRQLNRRVEVVITQTCSVC